jgi:hypothetical protein
MEHVTRIARIIDNPRGNAMLVGVGGSGKQSLTRLSAFISGYSVFQVKLTSTYSMSDFKADLFSLYTRTGLKGEGIVFLFTDQQILHERMYPRSAPTPHSRSVLSHRCRSVLSRPCDRANARTGSSTLTTSSRWACRQTSTRRRTRTMRSTPSGPR